ncbi:thiamine diphosphate-binding protein [Meredithblackwellia eburnea MCA 4105]
MVGTSDPSFPIPFVKEFKRFPLDPTNPKLTAQQKADLEFNIKLLRDVIILFTSTGAARGVSGHTGGAYDTVPEVAILLSLFEADKDNSKYLDIIFDEAGHRVATQYLLAALNQDLPAAHLLNYRVANSKLPGHPELRFTPGVKFSSGRLGHMWPLVNGVAIAEPGKAIFCLGSDGSQQEGDDAEAARLAVAKNLNVKLLVDNNDVTIAGHPSEYLKGYSVAKTLAGQGMTVIEAHGEDVDDLWAAVAQSVTHVGPVAVVVNRKMAPGIEGLEGQSEGHEAVPVKFAVKYLQSRGYGSDVTDVLLNIKPVSTTATFTGSTKEQGANRVQFGEAVNSVLDKLSKEEAVSKVVVIDSDLEGSTGLKAIHKKHPEIFIGSGIMERGNFSAAAGFGFNENGKVGIFSTFSAFLEMCISEITMARLNFCNAICHFSHSGCDGMSDNTCHFGINNFFADNGLEDSHPTSLYFPADADQMTAVVQKVFWDTGLRFIFSSRSKVPWILKENSTERFYGGDYKFVPGVDEVIRPGKAGVIIAFGEMLFRALDAVERLRKEGHDVGLVNKVTLNVIDEKAMVEYGKQPFVLVVESFNRKTGLGSKMGTWLLERGLTPKYAYLGTHKEGCGGLDEQIPWQGLDPDSIIKKAKSLIA